jgi:hypothetical protein
VDYAQLHKIFGAPPPDASRYSPATCIGCDMKSDCARLWTAFGAVVAQKVEPNAATSRLEALGLRPRFVIFRL